VAGEVASTHEVLRVATADVFESWLSAMTEDLVEAGRPLEDARSLALSLLAVLEGAFLLSRALRSVEPMRAGSDAAVALLQMALRCASAPDAPTSNEDAPTTNEGTPTTNEDNR
jgi:hypothetical protein